jgi:hypothetical protein
MKAATAVRTKATKVSDAATLDLMAGPADGPFRRCDVAITRASDGRLHIEIDVPAAIGQRVGNLLAALGVKAGR